MTSPLRTAIAESVRVAMARKRISQRTLATELELSQTAVFRRVNGDVDFTAPELFGVARVVGVPVEALYPGEQDLAASA